MRIEAKRLRGGVLAMLGVAACLAGVGARAQESDAGAGMVGGGRMVRGTVTAATADHLTMKTETGETYQVVVTANTRVMKGRDAMKLGDVHAGDGLGAMGEIDPATKTVHALYVMVVDAEQLKKAREAMGKTYIAGKVTAMDELKLTILRADNVSQVIEVDEGTSFRRGGRGMQQMMGGGGMGTGGGGARAGVGAGGNGGAGGGGEAITLADIKVGDTVAGPGALKNGVFVATQLAVGDPAAQGRRRRQGEGVPPATTAPASAPAEPK